jgi:hypothetical protein
MWPVDGRVPGAVLVGSFWAIPSDWKHVPQKRTRAKPVEAD